MKKVLLAVAVVLVFAQVGFAGDVYNFEIAGGGMAEGSPSTLKAGWTHGDLLYKDGSNSIDVGSAFMSYFQTVESVFCVIDAFIGDTKFRFQTGYSGLYSYPGPEPTGFVLFGDLTACDSGGNGALPSFSFQVP